jgi:hypothetical protein
MQYTTIILLAVTLPVFAGDPIVATNSISSNNSVKSAEYAVASESDRTGLAIKVTLEQGGKEVTSFTAYVTVAPNNDIFCKGVLSFNTSYWRVTLRGAIPNLQGDSSIEVDVEDLKLLTKESNGAIVPTTIFSVSQRPKELGKYRLGEIRGMALKLEISRAEQIADGKTPETPHPPH